MDKLNPPVALEDPQNELRLSFIKNFIVPLPEYETNFSTVSCMQKECIFALCIYRSSISMLRHYGMMKEFRKSIGDQMNIIYLTVHHSKECF